MKKLMALAVLFLFFTSCTTIEYTRKKNKADELYRHGVISKQEYAARVTAAIREVMSRRRSTIAKENAAFAILVWERWANDEISESERTYLIVQKTRELEELQRKQRASRSLKGARRWPLYCTSTTMGNTINTTCF